MICQYEKTIYSNNENGFGIYSFTTDDNSVPSKARQKENKKIIQFTGKGYSIPELKETELELDGKWVEGKYGTQLEIEKCISRLPKTKDGIIGYLSSGLIKGIGPVHAKNIVEAFGLNTLTIIETKPEQLLNIKGITKPLFKEIKESVERNKDMSEIMIQLSPFGITPKKVAKIQDKFGAKALEVVTKRPFELCNISGFGFLTVDDIAHKMQCRLDSPLRIRGAVEYTLHQAGQQGHLYLPANELVEEALKTLNQKAEGITKEQVQNEIKICAANDIVIADKGCVYLPFYYKEETNTAIATANILVQTIKKIPDLDMWIEKAQVKLKIKLSETQKEAVAMSLSNMVSIITGGPGTGKTTILKVILYIYQKTENGNILMVAPTGRASRKMSESTGFLGCSTVHSALGLTTESRHDQNYSDLDQDFIVLDESSMADMYIGSQLICRTKKGARILLVGDVDQLPSVGPGNVFRELIECGLIPVTRLDIVYRQMKNSEIAINAQKINHGNIQLTFGDDFQMREVDVDERAAELVLKEYQDAVKEFGLENVQILCPMRKRGAVSSNALNEKIREIMNPKRIGLPELKAGHRIYRKNDRIMHLKNTCALSNGDIGFITDIDLQKQEFILSFSDGRQVAYTAEEMDRVQLAYAVTIHKSQGTECSAVLIPILTSAYIMLKRNLIYTAVTRGKSRVIVIGQKKALAMAIQKNDIDKRNTRLGERIGKCLENKLVMEEKMKHLCSKKSTNQVKFNDGRK